MATFNKSLSLKTNSEGRNQILLFVFVTREIRFRVKTPVFVNPEYFDIENGDIVVPKRLKNNAEKVEEALKTRVELDRFITQIQDILLTEQPEGARNSKDWKDWLLVQLSKQSEQVSTNKGDNMTITNAQQESKEGTKANDGIDSQSIKNEPASNVADKRIKVVDALQLYAKHHKLSTTRVKSLEVIGRMLSRYILYITKTSKCQYELYADSITSEEVEQFRKYIIDEPKLAISNKSLFANIMAKFPLSTGHRARKKIANRGDNYVVDICKRLNAVFNWLNKTKRIDNQPFRNITIGSEVYGLPIYLTKEERNQIADYDLSQESEMLQTQRDIFIFQCLIGCRVCDLVNLTLNNITNGVLEYVPQKTQGNAHQVRPRIPLKQQALDLVEKYKGIDKQGRLFPFIASQNYNDCIKRIFVACEITRPVIVRNPTTGRNEIKPISEIASSHMARRTFVGATYKVVKDPNLIGAMSGHVPGSKAFARYRAIDDDDLRDVISKI